MPQVKKECQISIEHPSYVLMENIFQLYSEPYLASLLVQQIAYNCAIRKAYIDGKLERGDENLTMYGLNTFKQLMVYGFAGEEIFESSYTHKELYTDYPFIFEMESDVELDQIMSYPKVQKPLDKETLYLISQMQAANVENVILPNSSKLNTDEIPFFNYGKSKIAWNLTRAFYYFDAITFFGCTQSMLSRERFYWHGKELKHDNKTIKQFLSIIQPYITSSKYIDLI